MAAARVNKDRARQRGVGRPHWSAAHVVLVECRRSGIFLQICRPYSGQVSGTLILLQASIQVDVFVPRTAIVLTEVKEAGTNEVARNLSYSPWRKCPRGTEIL